MTSLVAHGPAAPAVRRLAWAAPAALLLAAAAGDARAETYKDARLGFSVNVPNKWKQMPISTDERWLVAQFQSERQWEWSDAKTDSWTYHQPKLEVVIIPNSAAEQKGAEVTKTDDKVVVKRQAPWRDIKEYLDKTLQQSGRGGFYFSKEEETKVGDMKVMVYEVTMDKFTSTFDNAPRKYFAWAFYAEDAIYGLIGDALIRWEDKLRPDIEAAFRSFKIFPRTGTLPGAEITPGDEGDVIVKKDPKKEHVTDEELRRRREEVFRQRLAKIKGSLAEGWKIKESENFVAVTHCDDRFTKEVLDHAEALRTWLEQNLGYVGSGYTGRIILRVCANDDERQAMWNSLGWSLDRCEVVTGQDRSGWLDNKLSDLNRGIYDIWLRDRNRDLSWNLPPWISWGLGSCVEAARSKGRRITDFKFDTWDAVQIAELRRAEKLTTARAFFSVGWEEVFDSRRFDNMRQAQHFVRFLLVGGAQRNARYRNLLGDYLKNLAMLIDEATNAKEGGEAVKEPENEQEETEQRRARAEAWKKREKEVLDKLLEKTFPGWTEKDWTQFNNAYWKELGV